MTRGLPPARRRLPAVALAVLLLIAGVAVAAGALAPYPPRATAGAPVGAPSGAHWLGTNDLGQDLLSQLLVGTRFSLVLGAAAAGLSTLLSGTVGVLAAAWPRAQAPLVALTDSVLAIPQLPALVLLLALRGPGPDSLAVGLALISWPAYARVVRSQARGVLRRDYVEAARAAGASDTRILRTCVLPEVLPVLWTKFLLTLRWTILMEATLALMGLGDPSAITWGLMLQTAFGYPLLFATSAWAWWALPPALAIAVLTVALSAAGRDFEAWLNPASGPGTGPGYR
ncbi:MAG: ABC transporter permease [Armatimonadota bacterium]|nr:ABC transporter permease [Armatimonadota bacterium]MDR7422829.1 ABC transporter permease [Armatimonadota bacterium]MDR7455115.1 ABC transporter permease [Armatimonadota bacterium]MDR7457088.1 ABC transporter permease [Armatimonadota bacterium]MDR7497487.1 ABC transporter permease [Armatimonadota bacterium]